MWFGLILLLRVEFVKRYIEKCVKEWFVNYV